ncbi:hypothetical protein Tco_0223891 [Tanacetum coccineum]
MTVSLEISRRAGDMYHNLQDDDIMKNIFNSGRHKDKVGMQIPDWMITEEMKHTEHYRMYAEVFGLDVPLTQSQPTESTQGTHRTPSSPRSPNLKWMQQSQVLQTDYCDFVFCSSERKYTRVTPPAPSANCDKRKGDDLTRHIHTRLEPGSDKGKFKGGMEITNDEDENHVVSKPVTLQTSPAKQRGVNSNKNVIAPGMYKVVTTHESQTNEAKHDLSSTGMNAASSVRRPMNRDSHVKNSVLANSKKPAKKVAVYVRKNKQTDITSENVISNKENVIDVDVANASKAKTLLCVSCMQNVLIPCHDNCFANYKLNVHSNVHRTLSTKFRTPKSYDTTYVAHKTRFSKESTLSKSLDTTYVVSKPKIDVGSTSKANDKDPQLQQQDIAIWLALQMKFESLQVPQTTCRPSIVRPRDQDDPHDDAHPEGENSAKR